MNERIVVLEDDLGLRETIRDLLLDEGYQVDAFGGGQEALDHLRTAPVPHLILLDVMLGAMDGFEFRRRQLADEKLAPVPVVVLSGTSDLPAIARVLQASAFLRKPFDVPTLLAVVADGCRDRGAR